MYKKYGIIKEDKKPIIIYTNMMDTTTKNMGDDYKLIKYDGFISRTTKKLIICLDIIENRYKIAAADLYKANEIIMDLLISYYDGELKEILKNIRYSLSTIYTLGEMLDILKIKNSADEIARQCYQDE